MTEIFSTIIRNGLMISSFVMVMMLLIEYINVISRGQLSSLSRGRGLKQIILSAFLGAIPGCLGGFAVVSLYTHGMLSFGAMIACMIATFGDEAFILLAADAYSGILLTAVLFVIAIVIGFVADLLFKKVKVPFSPEHFSLHEDDHHSPEKLLGNWKENFKKISFQRALLISGIVLIIIALFLGWFEHSHEIGEHHHDCACEHHGHSHDVSSELLQEKWLNYLFIVVSFITLWIVCSVNEHFLTEHLWTHIIKKHLPKILLWTIGTIAAMQFLQYFFNINDLIQDNPHYILPIALLIGLIPESGPHIIFITLYTSGTIPFSILLANSIVQEGHAGLPLLAESRRGFVYMKSISLVIALIAGLLGISFGF